MGDNLLPMCLRVSRLIPSLRKQCASCPDTVAASGQPDPVLTQALLEYIHGKQPDLGATQTGLGVGWPDDETGQLGKVQRRAAWVLLLGEAAGAEPLDPAEIAHKRALDDAGMAHVLAYEAAVRAIAENPYCDA